MRRLKTEDILTTVPFTVKCTHFKDREENRKKWMWVRRTNQQNAVFIVALVHGLMVVTKEKRIPTDAYIWGIPAGLIDPNEDPLETGKRELFEETGMKYIQVLKPTSPLVYINPGLTDEGCYFVYIKAEKSEEGPQLEATEDIKTYLYNQEQLAKLLASKKKIEAKARLIFERFVKHGDV